MMDCLVSSFVTTLPTIIVKVLIFLVLQEIGLDEWIK
jgi:hypothetical protein